MNCLKGKKCLITGAASGIGRATALQAAEMGADLFLTDINADMLAETVETIKKKSGQVTYRQALDIADFSKVKEMADDIHGTHGAMDIVMNIAGISVWGEVSRLDYRHWRQCLDIDLWGPIHAIICFLTEMINAGKGGHLVNVASAAGLVALPWHVAYSAAKFGLVGVSEVLRYDLMKHDIGVTVVCPGAVKTPLVQTVDIIGVDREHPEVRKLEKMFFKRAVSPEKVAGQIITGVKKNKFLVFTSTDIRFLYWLKRKHHWLYDWLMKQTQKIIAKKIEAARS